MKKYLMFFCVVFFCLVFSSVGLAAEPPIEDVSNSVLPLPSPTETHTYNHYILLQWSTGKTALYYFMADEPFTISGTVRDANTVYVNHDNDVRVQSFLFEDNSWVDKGIMNHLSTSGPYTTKPAVFHSSTFDITRSDGTLFFQVTPELYQTVLEVTEMEILQQKVTLGGTIRILVLCGVGLIALLMVLNLFGKVFNRFRV